MLSQIQNSRLAPRLPRNNPYRQFDQYEFSRGFNFICGRRRLKGSDDPGRTRLNFERLVLNESVQAFSPPVERRGWSIVD